MSTKETVDQLARAAGMTPPVDRTQKTLTDGSPVTDGHTELKPNGQQKGYVVLSAEERARGFVRPVRLGYVHVGIPGPKYSLRDLTLRRPSVTGRRTTSNSRSTRRTVRTALPPAASGRSRKSTRSVRAAAR